MTHVVFDFCSTEKEVVHCNVRSLVFRKAFQKLAKSRQFLKCEKNFTSLEE